MFAVRLEPDEPDGESELRLATSEVLKRNIRDYSKISLFDFTFDEFAEMAV